MEELVELVGKRLPPVVRWRSKRGDYCGGVARLDNLLHACVAPCHHRQVVQPQRRQRALDVAQPAAQPHDRIRATPASRDNAREPDRHLASRRRRHQVSIQQFQRRFSSSSVDGIRSLKRFHAAFSGSSRSTAPCLLSRSAYRSSWALRDSASAASRCGRGRHRCSNFCSRGRDEVTQSVVAALEELAGHRRSNGVIEAAHGGHSETDVEGEAAGGDPEEVADRRLADFHSVTRRVRLHQCGHAAVIHLVVERRGKRRQHAGNDLHTVCRHPHVVPQIRRGVPLRSKCPMRPNCAQMNW